MGTYRVRLNAVTVALPPDARIRVGRVPYDTKDRRGQLERIREECRSTHLVRYDGRDTVEVIPYDRAVAVPGREATIRLADRPELVEHLMFVWLCRALRAKGMSPEWEGQVRYLSTKPEHDLLASALPHGVTLPDGVSRRIATEFDFRALAPEDRSSRRLVLTINPTSRTLITCPVSDLMGRGFRPEGHYVLPHLRGGRGGRLLGKVRTVDGDILVLDPDETRSGAESIPAASAYLEPRADNLANVLRDLWPQFADTIRERLKRLAAERLSGPERLRFVLGWIRRLRELPPEVVQGVSVELGAAPVLSPETWRPDVTSLARPALVFAYGGTKTHERNQDGLDRHGPYGWERFPRRKPNIAVICQASKQSAVEAFVRRVLEGEPTAKYGGSVGMLKRYKLDPPYIRFFTTASSSPDDYRAACGAALEHMASFGKRWDLALVQIEARFRELRGDANPYLVTKAFLLAKEVPVQQFNIETIQKPTATLGPTLNNVGLASYAKIGGTPWLLPVPHKIARELVFGIGSHETTGSRVRARERYVGVTTVFSRAGEFLLESRTTAVPYVDYAAALLRSLETTIASVRRDQGWNDDDPVRLVFHVFKPLKAVEIDSVKELVRGLGIPDAQFAFLHIGYGHPYLLFDEGQNGVGERRKGKFAASRGVRVLLSDREALVALKGPWELKQGSDGLPRPFLVRLREGSTYTDIGYLAQQVFDFSCLSWRSMTAVGEPVTVLYSKLVAENLQDLKSVRGWVPEHALGAIGRTRWFL